MESPSGYINKIKNSLKYENRFIVDKKFNELLDSICKDYEEILQKGQTKLFRARIYNQLDAYEKYRNYVSEIFEGYDEEGSFVNKNYLAISDGRVNPSGIPYLYTSCDIDTCIKEVKPYADSAVSVAGIEMEENLKIVDLCCNFGCDSDSWIAEFKMLLCSAFSKPIHEKGDYLLSQYISEYIKNNNYDGIGFLSAFTTYGNYNRTDEGRNITIFNYEKCRAIDSKLYRISKVNIDYVSYGKGI